MQIHFEVTRKKNSWEFFGIKLDQRHKANGIIIMYNKLFKGILGMSNENCHIGWSACIVKHMAKH